MNSNTLLHSQASSTTELISKLHEQNLTPRYTKPDTPLHKTWHSVTQNHLIGPTISLYVYKHKLRLVPFLHEYFKISFDPSHAVRLSVCLSSSKQLTPSLCVFHILPPSYHPTPIFVLITCFRLRSSWICYVSNLKNSKAINTGVQLRIPPPPAGDPSCH